MLPKTFVINLPKDTKKLEHFRDTLSKHGASDLIDWSVWNGVNVGTEYNRIQDLVNKGYIQKPKNLNNKGNLGCAGAHLSLWDYISTLSPSTEPFLIHEDDVTYTTDSVKIIEKYANLMKNNNIDYINLNVLRPKGRNTSLDSELLRVNKRKWFWWMRPNVWASSYLMTPKGASRILRLYSMQCPDVSISGNNNDRCLSMAICKRPNDKDVEFFVMKHRNKYFKHDESDSSRVSLNNGLDGNGISIWVKYLWLWILILIVIIIAIILIVYFLKRSK